MKFMVAKKELTLKERAERKAKRIEGHRDRAAIVGTERAWKRWAMKEISDREFFETKPIKDLFNNMLKRLERGWKNRRLCREDFEEVMLYAAVEVLYGYSWASDYYLYETIKLAIQREAIDVTRTVENRCNEIWANALPLSDGFDMFYPDKRVDVVKHVTDRLTVEEMLNHWCLTEAERQLLRVVYENHDASLRELADLSGVKHKMEVSRTLQKIRGKLESFGFGQESPEEAPEQKREVR
jgi:hypothetical protein